VLGGIVGAAAARELADDESKGRQNTATVAGAVAGAVAGNAIQNRVQASGAYTIHVRMNDGRMVVVNQNDLGGIREGSYVRVYNGRAWAR
jgi:outer membrane lipoprotein SlyB